ncbi:P-loop containing nucleoside triphosphate hydrolase protein [Amylostereum chailletii]|nr:P-loop containing nucleoside triphosphate hydrolase protein [Amylostereum chailletii]
MSCNIPRTPTASLQWPPTRHTHRNPSTTGTPSLETPSRVLASLNLNTPRILAPPNLHSDSSPAPKPASSLGARRTYRNGYEVKPQAPSYRPYALNNQGYRRQHAFVVEDVPHIKSSEPLAQSQWDDLARTHKIIKAGWTVKPFQAECANHVLGRATDVCLIAPTGAGKSTLWVLPLGVQRQGISLVVTPYTSLGAEGELRMREMGFSSVFVHAGQNTETILISIARGHYRVIFVCAEELESPTFARVVHCEAFQNMLSAIYIDEAHLVRESESWRFPYTRLHMLRKIVGEHVPLVCLSATLPQEYRDALVLHAGLRKDYQLINLGNFRPELATAVVPMTHPATSFLDLSFVIPINSTALPDRTIAYTDDVERLTAMFWWFINRLAAANLPVTAVDILHAGLSDTHQEMCIRDFREGRTRILLGTAKIGCGMNFPGVKRVVQYMVRGLTLSGYRQREGRGGALRIPMRTQRPWVIFSSRKACRRERGPQSIIPDMKTKAFSR